MGWSIGYDKKWMRFIGYGVLCVCDHPECIAKIDRGLSHVCGGQPYGGDRGCGLYFCSEHGGGMLCDRCEGGQEPYPPKPDCDEWILHQATHPSWEEWRNENNVHSSEEIKAMNTGLIV